jgi:hypothetical protein
MLPQQRELPVVFRPHEGEALSSWLARTGSVYRLNLGGLLSECLGWTEILAETIDVSHEPNQSADLCRLTRAEESIIRRCTLSGSYPQWIPDWVSRKKAHFHLNNRTTHLPDQSAFHVCMQCLEDDLRRGDQFLRLTWLCAAVTICDKHHLPLWPVEQSLGSLQCIRNPSGALFLFYVRHQSRYSNRREDAAALRALCRFEQGLKLALDGQPSGLFGLEGSAFIAVATDLIWALLQPAAGDGTRVAHHLQVDHFRVPQGWRTPYCLSTLSGLDMRFRQAILATIACLLLPFSFAELITSTSYFSRQRACAFLLELLGEENTCALLARAPRWPLLFRVRMGNAARALRPRPGGRSQSID